ncbi:MAG: hypothetical protein F2659_02445 [Actinobacteria bacterium]|uniref:Unannotated protein n=1 Tax=freshwater metagenome TaxID=449393 RepID=A0A6J6NMH1_9ZZZZ|nr:hypothetical protein [Actinomycetota bacterium]
MLSRLAESYFWMGRYLERAEGTTRLLIEYHQLMVHEHRVDPAPGCDLLTNRLGLANTARTPSELVSVVYGGPDEPSTIHGSLTAARNNARSIRDSVPADFFEALNKSYLRTQNAQPDPRSPGTILRALLESLAAVQGVFDWIAPHDEARSFFNLGASLERLDIVARMLNMHIEREWPHQGPPTMLRAVGGLSTFLRGRVPLTAERVRSFLVTDSVFPRSLLHSATRSEVSIRDIATTTSTRVDSMVQAIGLLRSEIAYSGASVTNVRIESLVNQAIRAVAVTSTDTRDQFFHPAGSIVWSH